MTIGELSDKSGVPASTLRYWERIGVLPKTMRQWPAALPGRRSQLGCGAPTGEGLRILTS